MNDHDHATDWLSLIDISGPFLAEPVLREAFPQGLEGLDPAKRKLVRQAYDEWRDAIDLNEPDAAKIHIAWIELILKSALEYDEKGDGEVLSSNGALAGAFDCALPEYNITLHPNYVLFDGTEQKNALLLVCICDANASLTDSVRGTNFIASPTERLIALCRSNGVRLGLLTNGERWTLVDAGAGMVSLASWYSRLWLQEPSTLQAFVSLLGLRRFFLDTASQLPALLDRSQEFQDDVTDALGDQVRRAVELLIQSLDRADIDRERSLLDGVSPPELYEAGLTIMMRIVFLLSAEERGLLLMGEERYESNYAVSTLRMQLRQESEEVLIRPL